MGQDQNFHLLVPPGGGQDLVMIFEIVHVYGTYFDIITIAGW